MQQTNYTSLLVVIHMISHDYACSDGMLYVLGFILYPILSTANIFMMTIIQLLPTSAYYVFTYRHSEEVDGSL
jgi:hypothetical protein